MKKTKEVTEDMERVKAFVSEHGLEIPIVGGQSWAEDEGVVPAIQGAIQTREEYDNILSMRILSVWNYWFHWFKIMKIRN